MTIAGKYQPKISQVLPRGRSGGTGHVPFNLTADITTTVSLAHARQHTLISTADHTSAATSGQMLKADANGLPIDATNTDTDVASAVSLKHTAGTDTALGAVGTKNPPIDADLALYRDSTASSALVTSTWTQVKAFLKTYFDTLYNLYVHPNHSGDVTSVADGAQTIANKQTLSATSPITVSNTPTVVAAAAPAIALVNDAAATITEIDTGALADSDTVIPTSKAITTAIAGISGVTLAIARNVSLMR